MVWIHGNKDVKWVNKYIEHKRSIFIRLNLKNIYIIIITKKEDYYLMYEWMNFSLMYFYT